jgi:hypothetical protein
VRPTAVVVTMLGLTAVVGGCSLDPTESVTSLTVKNDLGYGVSLTACDDAACHSLPSTVNDHLAADQTMSVNVSSEGVPTYYRVTADSGGPSRCLALVAKNEQQPVLLSSSHLCGGS